jgi:hypothetical protein
MRRPELSAGIIAATAIMYPRLTVLVALFNLPLAARLLPTLSFLFIAPGGVGVVGMAED